MRNQYLRPSRQWPFSIKVRLLIEDFKKRKIGESPEILSSIICNQNQRDVLIPVGSLPGMAQSGVSRHGESG